MILIKIIHSVLFYSLAVFTFIFGTIITLPFALFAKEKHKVFHFSARLWARLLMIATGSKVTLSGLNNIPKNGGVILASNHQGALDILIHLAFMPRYFRFVAKSNLFKIPFFGWYMSLAGYVPIEREVNTSAHKTISSVSDVLSKGECVLIFPEGTRSKTGELGPFKRGSLMAAFSSGAAVVPIAISGSFQMMPPKTFLINRVPIKINIGSPIHFDKYIGIKPTKLDYEQELAKLRTSIGSLL